MDDYARGFFAKADRLIGSLERAIHRYGLQDILQADHACYKCDAATKFGFVRMMLEPFAPLTQSIISERRIAYFRFQEPILRTSIGDIQYLELADQKPHYQQKEGFDHVEAYPNGLSYDELVARIGRVMPLVRVERPHHLTYDADLGDGFTLKLCEGPLIEKIRKEL